MNVHSKTLYKLRSWDISSRFPIKLFTRFALKEIFLLDSQAFRLINSILYIKTDKFYII